MLLDGDTEESPSGVARRRLFDDDGICDEAFSKDLVWRHTPLIAGWERGDMTLELVEIGEAAAGRIIDNIKARAQ
jgi:hypothetical protein